MKIVYLVYTVLCFLTVPALAATCEPAPAAVIDIDANSYYTDTNHSVIDPARRAQNLASTEPVEQFLAGVARSASRYQASGRAPDAACALTWLEGWAGQRAMLGKMSSEQAYFVRKWTLAGLALSYARVQAAATPAQKTAIAAWLATLAEATLVHADTRKGKRNNHYYWEGLAVTAVGAVTHKERFLAWGRRVFDHAMAQVAPDGSLPEEMARGVKALHYHAFAAAPLTMIASILDLRAPALDRLVQFTLAAVRDPSALVRATGVPQEPVDDLPFAVIYARHMGQPASLRARFQARLGGDLALPNPLEHWPASAQTNLTGTP
ncbi:alginate lyase [Duganella sp. Leaf126]|uniref:alginate lyase family protein n=1 Tax=Duganella sp. Leaf126 TaxID=1736266 RepID=UPI0006F22D45|nr:alginate lyase family protein [Duganella sp. Leaf126]KQQ47592.1 alginate lyase [Duganella sp. Leaf126]